MQSLFIQNTVEKERIVDKYKSQLAARTQVLTNDIVSSIITTSRDCGYYFKKVAVDVVVQYSLGNPSQKEVSSLII